MAYIAIEWIYGRPNTGADQDEARASAAAEKVLDVAGVAALAEARGPELLPRKVPPKRLVAECKAEEPLPLAAVPFALDEPPAAPDAPEAPDVLPAVPLDVAAVELDGVVAVLPPELSR